MNSHLFRNAVCVWLAVTSMSLGTTMVTIADYNGDANAVSVAAGGSVVVYIIGAADEAILVVEGDLIAGSANILDLTALSYGNGWDQPGSDFGYPDPYSPPYGLDTSLHIGTARPDFSTVTGAFTFATMTILIDASAAPGTYSLRFTPNDIADDNFNTVDMATGPDYQITVTSPAPPNDGDDPIDPVDPVDPGEDEPNGPVDGGETIADEPNETTADDPAGSDDEMTDTEVRPTVSRPVCGAGVMQAALVGLTGLFLLQGRTRRRHSY